MAANKKTPEQDRLDKLEKSLAKVAHQNMMLAKKTEMLLRENRRLIHKTNGLENKIREIVSRTSS